MLGKIVFKAVLVFLTLTGGEHDAHDVSAAHGQPGSVQWGQTVMRETALRYSDAEIIDYRYDGSFQLPSGQTEERFKLWLRGQGREFGVKVVLRIKEDAQRMDEILFTETAD